MIFVFLFGVCTGAAAVTALFFRLDERRRAGSLKINTHDPFSEFLTVEFNRELDSFEDKSDIILKVDRS
ncbi:MAG: hypothetical protein NC078_10310 [Ruminococcus sp.]|nr:hypothetical protein [Ruminococcus sp.]